MANCRKPSASWRAPWAPVWPRLAVASCRAARESRNHGAFADHLVLGSAGLESARMDYGRVSVADVRPRRSTAARAVERSLARPPSYLCVGYLVRDPLSR